jgi:hypothetical protein
MSDTKYVGKRIQSGRSIMDRAKTSGSWFEYCECDLCGSARESYKYPEFKNKKRQASLDPWTRYSKAGFREQFLRVWINDIFKQATDLLVSKNKDYGSKSISGTPGGAMNGLIVRLHDKIERADNLTKKDSKPNHESINDTFLDIINYAAIAILVNNGKWDKLK